MVGRIMQSKPGVLRRLEDPHRQAELPSAVPVDEIILIMETVDTVLAKVRGKV
jgi:hypothetical protein